MDSAETKGDGAEEVVYKGKVNLVSQEGDKFEVPKKVRDKKSDPHAHHTPPFPSLSPELKDGKKQLTVSRAKFAPGRATPLTRALPSPGRDHVRACEDDD